MFGLMGLDYGQGFDQYDKGAQGYGQQTLDQIRKGQFHFTIGMNLENSDQNYIFAANFCF